MSSFTKSLITQYMPDTDNWMLPDTAGFRYWIGDIDSGSYVDIPDGFRSDGASVPRPFWNFIPPWGKHGQAAVLHDFLCTFRTIIINGVATTITRKQCDDIFLEAMGVLDVNILTRNIMYSVIRIYAISSFKR